MFERRLLIFGFWCLLEGLVFADEGPVVVTSQGAMKGSYLESTKGRTLAAFMAIPYALPPLGELRFKSPVEADSWKGVKDVSENTPQCIQNNPYVRIREVSGTEDCLYLAVYTPKKALEQKLSLPVMVFFHGGGWMCGTGGKYFYGPEHLLDHDVLLVGVNYRLNVFGMLSTTDEAASGNWALKDQNMALKWIQKHIGNFGGNPELVTIFGESAGGASVHYHMMSPKSEGLFHRAIMHSGTALCSWANSYPGRAQEHSKFLGKIMKCPTYNNTLLVDCLRTKKAEDLISADIYFYDWDSDPMIPYRPVIEPKNNDAFLIEDPRILLNEGRFAQIPVMIGINENEGALRSSGVFGINGQLQELSTHFDQLAPVTFDYQTSPEREKITSSIKTYYFNGNAKLIPELKKNLTDAYSDALFIAGIDESLRLQLPKSKHPIYFYHFTYKGSHSYSELFGDPNDDYGACHVDEMSYLLSGQLFPQLKDYELNVMNAMTTIWTNFAKSGMPHEPVRNTEIGDIPKWPAMKSVSQWTHVEIGEKLRVRENLAAERRNFWKNLPLWQQFNSDVYYKKTLHTEL